MNCKSLSRRLERLECDITPHDPVVIRVSIISAADDRVVEEIQSICLAPQAGGRRFRPWHQHANEKALPA